MTQTQIQPETMALLDHPSPEAYVVYRKFQPTSGQDMECSAIFILLLTREFKPEVVFHEVMEDIRGFTPLPTEDHTSVNDITRHKFTSGGVFLRHRVQGALLTYYAIKTPTVST